ncbi:hypothetical protein BDF19DRAFT_498569 [Syncephalis fuscata]|nr:hypothetical protein BDF19DRAFT_498569 [Syncephalis fuscata]
MSQRLATTALSRLVRCGELRKLPVYGTTAPNLSVYTAVSSLSPPSNTIDNHKNIIDKKDTKIADSSLTSDPNATLKAIVTTLESKYNQLQEIQQSNNTHEPMAVELDSFMQQLHDYNEIKDIGQMLLGKCAESEGCTIKEMHDRFSLHKEDMA